MKKISILASSLLFGGCSFFINKIDSNVLEKEHIKVERPYVPTYCYNEKPSLQLVGTNKDAQDQYRAFIKGKKLSFIDKVVFWSLIQFQIRPDLSSPTARLQYVIRHQKEIFYFDFFSEDQQNQYPYLAGLDYLLQIYKARKPLSWYTKELDQFKFSFKTGRSLAQFLDEHKDQIKKDQNLVKAFYRGNEVLKEDERLPVLNFSQIEKNYQTKLKDQRIVSNASLFDFVKTKSVHTICNYDFTLYENSIFLIDKKQNPSNIFGVAEDDSAFMATSGQRLDGLKSVLNEPVFQGVSKVRSSAVCIIEKTTKSGQDFMWLFSNASRDPGQHLYHLFRYGLTKVSTTQDVDKLLRHSRHLFLSEPVRLVIESERSQNQQIENLLKLNIPIYNSEKLGNVWAYTQFQKEGAHFIIDDRNFGAYSCQTTSP
ncbi:MAG: hypothetical protein ACOVP4_07975 [Bacteriovoracaceae bacterium]